MTDTLGITNDTNVSASDRPARARTGRLPLPRRVAELSAADAPSLNGVNAFADRLAEIPLDAWLDVGRAIAGGTPAVEARSAACATLTRIIAEHGLDVAAWYARDAVETAAFYIQSPSRRLTSEQRRVFAASHGAAEDAALALLARAHLPTPVFDTLIAPFQCFTCHGTESSSVPQRTRMTPLSVAYPERGCSESGTR